ncbi:SWIM zinc finger family protein [Brachyspira catarrhinii]|uniref:SWIM zinc finger family protein n=1 Tax=Brachyspira catarrhinii TaxID=2528966 RepID=A0ABY2TQH9_9SPIR|nr:SWIM zinc finger family protein [Brachyspira catarrhinii]TKZ35117.1 SWIM zinc finger family protein [Brachyspira catarrhinii]
MKNDITDKLKILKKYTEENFLISLTNKGIYNRALKDFKNMQNNNRFQPIVKIVENKIKISFDNTEIFFTENIKEATCNCPSKKICKHIIIALLYIKELTKDFKTEIQAQKKFEEINNIKNKNTKKESKEKNKIIDSNILEFSKNFIENIFAKGFYGCHEKDFDTAEQIATKLNINEMPELAKLFRSLSQSIDAMINKKAFFNKIFTMKTLSKIYNTINAIENAKKNNDETTIKLLTGENKNAYIEKSSGEFIGLGAYPWISSSGYFGLTSILYDLISKKICFYSHTLPTFYDDSKNLKNLYDDINSNYYKKIHWENNISMETISKYKIKLTNYKINNENRISSSKKTSVIVVEKIDYDFIKNIKEEIKNSKLFISSFEDIKNIDFKFDYFNNKNEAKILISEFQKIENINFDKVSQILFFDILNNNEKLTLNIKYNQINSHGFDYIKNYKNSEIDKNKFIVFTTKEKSKFSPISFININAVINIFFER